MGVKMYHKNRFNRIKSFRSIQAELIKEKKIIEKHYDFLTCSIAHKRLVCVGATKPTPYSKEYTFKIEYDGINSPKVFVLDPMIDYNDDIHMYPSNNSLCLYHQKTDEFYWSPQKHHLYDTIIPWTLEWFVYYELYNITGKWEHPFVSHKRIKEDNKVRL